MELNGEVLEILNNKEFQKIVNNEDMNMLNKFLLPERNSIDSKYGVDNILIISKLLNSSGMSSWAIKGNGKFFGFILEKLINSLNINEKSMTKYYYDFSLPDKIKIMLVGLDWDKNFMFRFESPNVIKKYNEVIDALEFELNNNINIDNSITILKNFKL